MPLPLLAIPLAISAATSLGKVAYGAVQAIGGNKKLNDLEKNRPQRTTDENILYNQKLAGVNAANGLSGQAKNQYTNDINRNLASSINAILSGGGDINQVADLMRGSNDSFNRLMVQDAEAKLNNQNTYMTANTAVANENMANWDYNVNIPFQQKYSRYTQRTNAGAQNINTGLDALGKTALAAVTGFSQGNDGNLFKAPSGATFDPYKATETFTGGQMQDFYENNGYYQSFNPTAINPNPITSANSVVGAPTQGFGTSFTLNP
jgi:hypothetical protein